MVTLFIIFILVIIFVCCINHADKHANDIVMCIENKKNRIYITLHQQKDGKYWANIERHIFGYTCTETVNRTFDTLEDVFEAIRRHRYKIVYSGRKNQVRGT